MPLVLEVANKAPSGSCVGTQISARSVVTIAVQFIGSIVAWAKNGALYVASTCFTDPAIAEIALPSSRKLKRPVFVVSPVRK